MTKLLDFFIGIIQHYNHKKYWKYREYVQNHIGKPNLKLLWYVWYIKKTDAFHNASTGITFGEGSAYFESPPILPHGLNGIIIAQKAKIGSNVCIFHQVTIGNDNRKSENVPEIGNNVIIYPGAKIFGKIKIGDNVKIAPNAVVYFDVPSNSTVVAGNSYIKNKSPE